MDTSRESRLHNELGFHLSVSEAMRSGTELDRLLSMVLAGIVHPRGLDFDRAFLFIADEHVHRLRAADAVGPFDEDEFRKTAVEDAPELNFDGMLRAVDASRADPETRRLARRLTGFEVPVSASAPPITAEGDEVPVHTVVAHCAARKEPFFSNTIQAFFQPPPAAGGTVMRFQRLVGVPLLLRDTVLGVLVADNTFSGRDLDKHDVTSLKTVVNFAAAAIETDRLRRRIQESASRDGLTGVYNRRFFEARLGKDVERAREASRALALLVFCIHGFKALNERHGYEAGDGILKDLAEFLSQGVRTEDMIVRFDQDVFLVMLTGGATQAEALKVTSKLMAQLPTQALGGLEAGSIKVGAGVAWLPAPKLDRIRLATLVDQAIETARLAESAGKAMAVPLDG